MADTSTIPSSMKAGLVGAGFSTTGYNGTIKIPDTSTITNKVLNSDILFEKSTMGMTRSIAKIGNNPKPKRKYD